MPEIKRHSPTPEQSQHLDAARLDYARLLTGRGDASDLVSRIRANLKQAASDAQALDLSGNRSAEEIEQIIDRRLSDATRAGPAKA